MSADDIPRIRDVSDENDELSARRRTMTDPFIYLASPPTEEEQRLAEACNRHSGDHTPFHMLAKVAVRLYRVVIPVERMHAFMRRGQRYVMAAATFAALNLGGIGIWVIDRSNANAVAREHAADVERAIREYREASEREMQDLRTDIRELRAELRRISGAEPAPPGAESLTPPDKFSMLP